MPLRSDFSINAMRDLDIRVVQHLRIALPADALRACSTGLADMTVVAAPVAPPRRLAGEDILMRAASSPSQLCSLVFIALPLETLLLKSFQDGMGRFVGLANYGRYFSRRRRWWPRCGTAWAWRCCRRPSCRWRLFTPMG